MLLLFFATSLCTIYSSDKKASQQPNNTVDQGQKPVDQPVDLDQKAAVRIECCPHHLLLLVFHIKSIILVNHVEMQCICQG